MPKPILGWVRDRWMTVLEPALRPATVQQEEVLHALWLQELDWWKQNRGLDGDSLRNPLTNVRTLIKQIPLTDENSYVNEDSGEREHIGLAVFNLRQHEWVSLNDRQHAQTQKRLEQEVFIQDPDAIVQRALPLLLSREWPELVVGIALCTGRRLAEVMKTGIFTPATASTVWFEGQVKASHRPRERFEVPTLARAYLVIDAVERLRHELNCSALEVGQISQRYGKAVNETVDRIYRDLIPVRVTKSQDAGPTIHVLRAVYAHIAVLWFDPPPVDPIHYMAQIQGHRFITTPQVDDDATEEEVREVQLNYASHAHYADYQILGPDGHVDGRRGIKLGQPGIQVLGVYEETWRQWLKTQGQVVPVASKKGKKKAKPADQNKTGYSSLRPLIPTKDWVDDLREQTCILLHRSEIKDDEIIRRMAAAYESQLLRSRGAVSPAANFSLDALDVSPDLRDLLHQGMVLSGAGDVLSFLLVAGSREARQLQSQVRKHDSQRYEALPTSELAHYKVPEATHERIRRAVYTVMCLNEQMSQQGRLNDLWCITMRLIQALIGGRKEPIAAYLDVHRDEIEAHHTLYKIQPVFNRKAQPPKEVIALPEHPEDYPWGVPPSEMATPS